MSRLAATLASCALACTSLWMATTAKAAPQTAASDATDAGLSGALISSKKRMYASTSQDRERDPVLVIDSNATTRWGSGFVGRAWLMIDLGGAARIDRVEIDWETAWSSHYTIEVSNDHVTWAPVGQPQTNPFVQDGITPRPPESEYRDAIDLNPTSTYRYLRVNSTERGWAAGDGSSYGISMFELRVYGAGGKDNPKRIAGPPPPQGDTWASVWADECDSGATTAAPDPGKWGYELGDGCDRGICGWGNGEREFYTNSIDNVFVKDGHLNIQLRKNHLGHAYTSGRITTQGKFEFTYGKVMARLRMITPESSSPGAKDGPVGVWGAFWLLGFDVNDPYVGWPYSGEQDIMENIGYSWWTSSALHGPGYSGGASIGGAYNKVDTPDGIALGSDPGFKTTDWHTYAAVWTDKKITFFIDGKAYRVVKRSEVQARGEWVYNKPNFILLNLAYDGAYPAAYRNNPLNFTGSKTAEGLAVDAENNFPHTMQVDWVRVFQRQ